MTTHLIPLELHRLVVLPYETETEDPAEARAEASAKAVAGEFQHRYAEVETIDAWPEVPLEPEDMVLQMVKASETATGEWVPPGAGEQLGLIGHDRAVVEGVADKVLKAAATQWDHTDLHEERRGSEFEIREGSHVIRVSIELVRVEG